MTEAEKPQPPSSQPTGSSPDETQMPPVPESEPEPMVEETSSAGDASATDPQVGEAQLPDALVGEAQPVVDDETASQMAAATAAAATVAGAVEPAVVGQTPTPSPDVTGTSASIEPEAASAGGSGGRTVALIVGAVVVVILIVLGIQALTDGGDSGSGGEEGAPAPPTKSNITINDPVNGTVLDISAPVSVSGTGAGLPEGNVVVQALDANNVVLAEQPTTIQAPDAGTGGEGPWSVQLSINTALGTTGRIRAFSTSPADGSIVAEATVNVQYGRAADE